MRPAREMQKMCAELEAVSERGRASRLVTVVTSSVESSLNNVYRMELHQSSQALFDNDLEAREAQPPSS